MSGETPMLHARFIETVKLFFPGANLGRGIVVQDDGAGPYLKVWPVTLGAPPTSAEIDALVPQLEAAKDGAERKAAILAIEAAYPVTQRFLREAILAAGEQFPAIKATPGYMRAADAEAAIAQLRSQ